MHACDVYFTPERYRSMCVRLIRVRVFNKITYELRRNNG